MGWPAVCLRSRRSLGPVGAWPANHGRQPRDLRVESACGPVGFSGVVRGESDSFGSGTGEGADPGGRRTGHEAGPWVGLVQEGDGMAYRGGPWRADGPRAPVVREGRRPGNDPTEQTTMSDRMLRRVV